MNRKFASLEVNNADVNGICLDIVEFSITILL